MKSKAAGKSAADEPPPPPPVAEAVRAYVQAIQQLLQVRVQTGHCWTDWLPRHLNVNAHSSCRHKCICSRPHWALASDGGRCLLRCAAAACRRLPACPAAPGPGPGLRIWDGSCPARRAAGAVACFPGSEQAAGASHNQVSASCWQGRQQTGACAGRWGQRCLPTACCLLLRPCHQPRSSLPHHRHAHPFMCCVCRRLEALAEPGAGAAVSDDDAGSVRGEGSGSDGGEGRVQRGAMASHMTHGRRAVRIQHELAPVRCSLLSIMHWGDVEMSLVAQPWPAPC
jgi:hypothetical protein